jgi:zinc/manganese transport system substrate-binding protein
MFIFNNGRRTDGMPRQGIRLAGAAGILLVTLSACSATTTSPPESATVTVVASTNVYGDIVRQIAGDRVTVTSMVSDPTADPHSYEASAQNQLALSKADVVIENGGGYDDFIDTMLSAANNTTAVVLNAVEISGRTAAEGEELNEHVWYDFPAMTNLADRLADALSTADGANSATYNANAATFKQKLAQLAAAATSVRSTAAGTAVAITEPVPLYLLEACGLVNQTPDAFSEAIEEGGDVPASVLGETLDLFTGKRVRLLAYNEQTAGPETRKVLDAAKANGVPVVSFTETLPPGKDYLTWMSDNVAAVKAALT